MKLREKLRSRWQIVTVLVVALVLAIGVGPTVASHLKVRSSDIVNGQVKTPDLHKNAITNKKLHQGAVTGRTIRDHGVGRVDLGRHAITAQAYAYVNDDGTVDETRSMHISDANLSHSNTGYYCVSGLSFDPQVATTMLTSPGPDIGVETDPTHAYCPNDSQLMIRIFHNGSAFNTDFMIVVY